MPILWDFSDAGVTFDNPGVAFDGSVGGGGGGGDGGGGSGGGGVIAVFQSQGIPGSSTPQVATLNDLFHWWGTDLTVSASGGLLQASGTLRGRQRVMRRLLTNPATADAPGDYIFQPEYGAGLPAYIGAPIDTQKITAAIRAQMLLEDAVAPTPAPVITVEQIGTDAFSVSIAYSDAATNKPATLSFSVGA